MANFYNEQPWLMKIILLTLLFIIAGPKHISGSGLTASWDNLIKHSLPEEEGKKEKGAEQDTIEDEEHDPASVHCPQIILNTSIIHVALPQLCAATDFMNRPFTPPDRA
jgi:hypothetical protein